MGSNFALGPIGAETKRGWRVFVDGEEVVVGKLELVSKYGILTYGQRPEGYDSWVFREAGAGGSITIPFSRSPKDDLLVGFLYENRANMGDSPVACATGGFVDAGETHKEAQARETLEETGVDSILAMEIPGYNTNANRAFFVCDAEAGEGVHAYGLRIPYNQLEEAEAGMFRIRQGAAMLLSGVKREADIRFLPWRKAVQLSPDGLFQAGVARLLAQVL